MVFWTYELQVHVVSGKRVDTVDRDWQQTDSAGTLGALQGKG